MYCYSKITQNCTFQKKKSGLKIVRVSQCQLSDCRLVLSGDMVTYEMLASFSEKNENASDFGFILSPLKLC